MEKNTQSDSLITKRKTRISEMKFGFFGSNWFLYFFPDLFSILIKLARKCAVALREESLNYKQGV
ncbi:MAG: hypothetical protein ACPGVD_10000, partial [Flavobacteriales bacterium]